MDYDDDIDNYTYNLTRAIATGKIAVMDLNEDDLEDVIIFEAAYMKSYKKEDEQSLLHLLYKTPSHVMENYIWDFVETLKLNADEIPAYYMNSPEFVRDLVRRDINSIANIPERYLDNEAFMQEFIAEDTTGIAFKYLSNRLYRQFEFNQTAVEMNSANLEHVHEKFQHDKSIIETALRIHSFSPRPDVWKYVPDTIQKDREYFKKLIEICPKIFMYGGDTFRRDMELARIAVTRDSEMYAYCHYSLQDNEELLNVACQTTGKPFIHASSRLRENLKIVKPLLKRFPSQIQWAGFNIKNNLNVAHEIAQVTHTPILFQFLSEDMRNHAEIAQQALASMPKSMEFVSDQLKHDIDFLRDYVNTDNFSSDSFEFLDEAFFNNAELVKIAYRKTGAVLQHAHRDLSHNTDFLDFVLEPRNVKYGTNLSRGDYHQTVLSVLKFDFGSEPYLKYFLEKSFFYDIYQEEDGVSNANILIRNALKTSTHKNDFTESLLQSDDVFVYLQRYELHAYLQESIERNNTEKRKKIKV